METIYGIAKADYQSMLAEAVAAEEKFTLDELEEFTEKLKELVKNKGFNLEKGDKK